MVREHTRRGGSPCRGRRHPGILFAGRRGRSCRRVDRSRNMRLALGLFLIAGAGCINPGDFARPADFAPSDAASAAPADLATAALLDLSTGTPPDLAAAGTPPDVAFAPDLATC